MRKNINNKGVVVIYVAIGIIVLIAFVGLAVDIGYMYVVKGQLQNAADAAALAGAAKLDGTNSIVQADCRNEAVAFAQLNKAGGDHVVTANDGSNALSDSYATGGNDITVGNWDPKLTPNYLAGRTPINAVQVRTRRTVSDDASPQKQVAIFFGKVIGWAKMGSAVEAIANRVYRSSPFPLCFASCNVTTQVTGTKFYLKTQDGSPNVGWTSLLDKSTDTPTIVNIINNNGGKATCGDCIYTTQGVITPALNAIADQLAENSKTYSINSVDGAGTPITVSVTGWKVLLPILDDNPLQCDPKGKIGCFLDPGTQAHGGDAYKIINFAEAIIVGVDKGSNASITMAGLGPPNGANTSTIACKDCSDPSLDPIVVSLVR